MAYHNYIYLFLFLPIVMIAYQLCNKKYRYLVMLLGSITFYLLMSSKLIVYLLLISLSTYVIGLGLSQSKQKYKRFLLCLGILIPLGILTVFKYYNFIGENLNSVIKGFELTIPYRKFIQPIGVSFFSLQAISYLVDVKMGKTKAEQNPLKILLYLLFFPTIIEGPIARYDQVIPQLSAGEAITYSSLTFGLQRILWGLIKKIVIADRLDPFVGSVFKNVDTNGGVVILIAILAYTLQLYSEFSGTMDIVLGSAEIFGVKLPENFNQPFFSRSASEFWRRWHMTLGGFFKDYIFYPISLSKFNRKLTKSLKAKIGKRYSRLVPTLGALLLVWICNGLWHGAQWQYLAYGMYYFVIIALGMILEPIFSGFFHKTKINRESRILDGFRWVRTMVIVNVGMMLFRSHGLSKALSMFIKMIQDFNVNQIVDGSLLNKGMDIHDFGIILIGFTIMVVVGFLKENHIQIRSRIAQWKSYIRIPFYYAAMLFLVIFGAYGYGYAIVELIYANF
ncbi:MBOAT family protein [Erysipelothrix rhusiopathiae]|nr:MBOAT family O-acyltransferase [Erysipelothrix rhusiopathiae]RNM29489.1 MBOAT family protein [Erysipelothrix rhusiopathiae]